MSDRCSLVLPYPPSLNHYWRRVGAKTLISAEGRAYREHVILLVRMAKVERLDGILGMEAVFHPPEDSGRDAGTEGGAAVNIAKLSSIAQTRIPTPEEFYSLTPTKWEIA